MLLVNLSYPSETAPPLVENKQYRAGVTPSIQYGANMCMSTRYDRWLEDPLIGASSANLSLGLQVPSQKV